MTDFKTNASIIMKCLDEYQYCTEVVHTMQRCISELEEYLAENHLTYSPKAAAEWYENISEHSLYKTAPPYYRSCLSKLEWLYLGRLDQFFLSFRKAGVIPEQLQSELKEYLEYLSGKFCADTIKNQGRNISYFLRSIQQFGVESVSGITYEIIDSYLSGENASEITKIHIHTSVREFLEYWHSKDRVTFGISIYFHYVQLHGMPYFAEVRNDYHRRIRDQLKKEDKTYPIEILIDFRCLLKKMYSENDYAKTTRSEMIRPIDLLILFLDRNQYTYSPSAAWIWFEKVKEIGICVPEFRRTLCLLEQYALTGKLPKNTTFRSKKQAFEYIPAWSKEAAGRYVNMKISEGWTRSTVDIIRSSLVRFCNCLDHMGVRSFADLTEKHIKQFDLEDKHKTPYGKNAYNSRIRKFLIFLGENHYIQNPMLFVSLTAKSAPIEPIVVVLTKEETEQLTDILKSEESGVSLRKKAVLLLGLKMGLRGSDIVELKWSDINWKDQSIRFIQKKTQVEVRLPMPVSVGNMLYRYITEERYESDSPYVFISEKAPHQNLRSSACYRALHSALPERKVEGSGFHVMRKTYATSLLRAGVGANMVAEALGQTGLNSVHRYLSLDKERMKECALTFEQTGIDGW